MFERFQHRSTELERLDTGDYTRGEYKRWQSEMRFVHNFWGEKAALRNSLIQDVHQRRLHYVSVLDVGAGDGNILKLVREMLSDRDVLGVAAEMSDDALKAVRRDKKKTHTQPVKCSGLCLPFGDYSIDYAISTFTLHHLSDEGAVTLIAEMCRVSKRRFFVIDLNRHPVGYYAWRLFSPLIFQKFTREDGALSILRSRTADEMIALAKQAGVSEVKVQHSRANRLVLSGR